MSLTITEIAKNKAEISGLLLPVRQADKVCTHGNKKAEKAQIFKRFAETLFSKGDKDLKIKLIVGVAKTNKNAAAGTAIYIVHFSANATFVSA